MEKQLEQYLYLYLGCDVVLDGKDLGILTGYSARGVGKEDFMILYTVQLSEDEEDWTVYNDDKKMQRIKPILRPISDMTDEEGEHLAWLLMDSERHLEADSRVTKEEIQSHIHQNDGGNLLDIDFSMVIEVSCRCFEGQIAVYPNGDIKMWDDDEKDEPVENIAAIVTWMLSKGFDLFGLIESGLAIDKTKITALLSYV